MRSDPVSDVEIARTAFAVIQQHGSRAQHFAQQSAEAALARGDQVHHAVWRRVLQAIVGMQGATEQAA